MSTTAVTNIAGGGGGGGGTRRTTKPSLSNHTSTGEALSTIDLNNGANHPSRSAGGGAGSAAASKPLRGGASSSAQPPVLLTTVMVAIAVCCVASIAMSTTHVQYQFGDGSSSISGVASIDSRQPSKKRTNGDNGGSGSSSIAAALSDFHGQQNKEQKKEDASLLPFYPKLQCKAYGGPSEKEAQEMVYWQGKCVCVCVASNLCGRTRACKLVSPLTHIYYMRSFVFPWFV
jgi:hypothetical protein